MVRFGPATGGPAAMAAMQKKMMIIVVLTIRVAAPNDPKLSDGGGRRGTCMAGGMAAVEAGAVTHVAWLGVAGVVIDVVRGWLCLGGGVNLGRCADQRRARTMRMNRT